MNTMEEMFGQGMTIGKMREITKQYLDIVHCRCEQLQEENKELRSRLESKGESLPRMSLNPENDILSEILKGGNNLNL